MSFFIRRCIRRRCVRFGESNARDGRSKPPPLLVSSIGKAGHGISASRQAPSGVCSSNGALARTRPAGHGSSSSRGKTGALTRFRCHPPSMLLVATAQVSKLFRVTTAEAHACLESMASARGGPPRCSLNAAGGVGGNAAPGIERWSVMA
ncbi:unnamed protein product [Prorocentrum cordatum]|uniref:Uncharacterized protein n=1 Tax=Prorocentrum cordatum TaxID=2364126 RepID=A0ABN9WBS1_9DINO|nr:unnamed protein product [Polarella glacialis]